ncbi:MAG TPA: tetratricopeptide repeat protein, partial [Roseiarcus sp.]|nr:tetratricopeptide repeat protein [Roseiarcus sp.]
GDAKAAAQLLGAESLAKEPEAQLWRASLAAQAQDWPTAAQAFTAGASFLPRYPKLLRRRFALDGAEALIETGQAAEAEPLLQVVESSDPTSHDAAEATFLDGRRLLALGNQKQAIAAWDKVAGMDDREARARAGFAKIVAELQTQDVSRADAIKALDRLRFAWRGGKLEFDLLRRLGELKLADGDPHGAFDTLREAAGDFPDDPQAKDVAKQLSDDVAELFLGHGLDDLPPLRALTLYDEFKDYLPVGERGDTAVRRLVDRLVAVDLLDRAAALLEDQVVHRLTGKEKARVAGQLAVIRLLDNRPADALKALDIDVGKDMSADMMRQRQQLRARALTELNRSDEALAILASDNSRDADRLRADIFWRTRNWTEAAKVFARLVPPPGAPTLMRADAQLVLNWASALTLAGDQLGLSDLRSGYGTAMAATPFADAFHVIAEDPVAGGPDGDPRALANRVAQVGELQSFMNGLKEKVEKDKLSAVN